MTIHNKNCSADSIQIFGTVTVGSKGQIVIPKDVRELLDIKPGDTLVVTTKFEKAIGLIKANDLPAFMAYLQNELSQ